MRLGLYETLLPVRQPVINGLAAKQAFPSANRDRRDFTSGRLFVNRLGAVAQDSRQLLNGHKPRYFIHGLPPLSICRLLSECLLFG